MATAAPSSKGIGAVVVWARQNLFSSPLNTLLTVRGRWLLWLVLPPVFQWVWLKADFSGSSRADCTGDGACWVFVRVHLTQFLYGFYPAAERWRINVGIGLLLLVALPLLLPQLRRFRRSWSLSLVAYPFIAWWLFHGGLGLPLVETGRWGGLFLTMVIAGTGMAAALPLGIVLALGRRSQLPVVRAVCTVFIEFWRGVPLITVLFMASVMLPLFMPAGVSLDKLLRALIGVALFAGAYMAEVIRGGLQGVPAGQYEAARALGLSYWQQMRLIIVPQALRMVVPGIVNVFIALFKETSLVLIIGLFDLLGIVQAAVTNPDWLGFVLEGYVFAAAVFWAFCYGMSRLSRRLERRPELRARSQQQEMA
jgi:general L-amino acid transport system permease protein